uniref:CSON005731 protein n=1 Tax=Culicoides sonorensis TaxID=179676 RepID=A0A336LVK6_CULSO
MSKLSIKSIILLAICISSSFTTAIAETTQSDENSTTEKSLPQKFDEKTENCASQILANQTSKISRKDIAQWSVGNFPDVIKSFEAKKFVECLYKGFNWSETIKNGLKSVNALNFLKDFNFLNFTDIQKCNQDNQGNILEIHKCIVKTPENQAAILTDLTGKANVNGAYRKILSKLNDKWNAIKLKAKNLKNKFKDMFNIFKKNNPKSEN